MAGKWWYRRKGNSRCNDLTIHLSAVALAKVEQITPQHAAKYIFIRVDASGARLWNEFAPGRTQRPTEKVSLDRSTHV